MGSRLKKLLDSIRVAIYIRVSTRMQVDKDSLPVQRADLINYCKYVLGTENYEVFEDAGYSAKNTDRPDYQKMMARVRTGEFTHVLVWKLDRISRNLLDFAAMYQEFEHLGMTFISKNEQFDTSTAIGQAMLQIIMVFAELERKMTSERVTAIMLARASEGQWNGGKVPFGYQHDAKTHTFSFRDDEAPVVNLIGDLYDQHGSLVYVAKELNRRGYTARSGKPWNPVTVRTILVNPFNRGAYRYNYREMSKNNRQQDVKPEDEWVIIEDHHPAYFTMERQEGFIKRLQENRRNSPFSGKTYTRANVHIFSGLLRCWYCGSNMVATSDKARSDGWRPSFYTCSRQRRFNDCPNKYISDLTLGPFVFNYISNMLRAKKSFGKSTTIDILESKLLRGETFEAVDHIERSGLEELYQHFKSTKGETLYFERKPQPEAPDEAEERDILLSQKRKTERALDRLKTIYLYGDGEGIGEAEYIFERKRLLDSLESTNARLDELEANASNQVTLSDEELFAQVALFDVSHELTKTRHINYESMAREITPAILKEFVSSVCANFCIKSGRIASIRFKNGIEHKFVYHDEA